MRVVLIGAGGRESALAWRMSRSPTLTELVCTHAHPGWPEGTTVRAAPTVPEQVSLAREVGADLVVVGPEAYLQQGIADALAEAGVPCFGPTAAAARLETSKAFCKEVCREVGVPQADALVVERHDAAGWQAAKERCRAGRVVLKADGLAAGKGVIVCRTPDEALAGLDEMARFGEAAQRLVLEELLEGPEVSVFALCDGARTVALPSSQDHKTLLDGGKGPNTGGMGAYAPCPLVDPEATRALVAEVHQRVVVRMAERGTPFRGVLYGGFMLTEAGPKLLEFNTRFGDPECQPLMAIWKGDLLPWLHGAATGQLPEGEPEPPDQVACCVVLASAGYPASSDKGRPIPEPAPLEGVVVFQAGTARGADGVLRTNGGRVLGVTGVGVDHEEARRRAYAAVEGWRFEGAQLRTDVGASVE